MICKDSALLCETAFVQIMVDEFWIDYDMNLQFYLVICEFLGYYNYLVVGTTLTVMIHYIDTLE